MLRPYVIFGTSNRHKALEATEIVASSGVVLRPLSDFPKSIDVVEDGATFGENARKKAIEQARFMNDWLLAEDSGICVDYLDGAPGVYSARFAGAELRDDERNNDYLLERLEGVPLEKRTAHYACHAVLCDPTGEVVFETEGICAGRIIFERRGTNGFGYDPLFEVDGYGKTFGELPGEVKSKISHRAKAMNELAPVLARLVEEKKLPTFEY